MSGKDPSPPPPSTATEWTFAIAIAYAGGYSLVGAVRHLLGMDVRSFAEACGLTLGRLAALEEPRRVPTEAEARAIEKAFGVPARLLGVME